MSIYCKATQQWCSKSHILWTFYIFAMNEKPNIAMILCRDAATNLMISVCAMFTSILNMNAVIFKKQRAVRKENNDYKCIDESH